MKLEKRRKFIIDFLYFAIVIGVGFCILKYAMPIVAPFLTALFLAYVLRKPIRFLARKLHLPRKLTAALVVLLFYCTIGVLIALVGVKLFAAVKDMFTGLPVVYKDYIEPFLLDLANHIERLFFALDAEVIATIESLLQNFAQSMGDLISGLSVHVISGLSGMASSLPGFFVKMVLTIIATFFIAIDYDHIVYYLMKYLGEKPKSVFISVKNYISGTLLRYLGSYACIMLLTFVELSVGLLILRVDNALLIALGIAIFDILPVLGTGGIMIPWGLIKLLQGDFSLALGIGIVYAVVTIVRNIIEPKIVGSQIGLHPVVTLMSMFVGVQIFGAAGLFGLPIGLSIFKQMIDDGTIQLFHPQSEATAAGQGAAAGSDAPPEPDEGDESP